VTAPLDPRLDDFERRLHELEHELAELRLALAAVDAEAAVEPPGAGDVPAWAQQWIDRGDFRELLSELESARRQALRNDDLAALAELLHVAELVADREPDGLESRAVRLAEALRQNMRFVERKLAAPTDDAELVAGLPRTEAPPRAEPPGWDEEQRPAPPQPAWNLPSFSFPELTGADLFGAKALAIAGGIVTLLGIVFFFVLAVNRGWIGPGGRVALGAFAAALVFSAGLELRRRYGETHSSLAAVGAGIAGGYAVLLAAAALYHFVGHPVALVIAAAIAAVGTVTALRWQSQIVAGIGLLGATLAPLAVAAQGGLSALGTAFVAVMAVATAIVAIRRRWDPLLIVGTLAALSQALALVLQAKYEGESPVRIVALAAVFSAITVGTAVARQLRERTPDLRQLPTSFLFAGAVFAAGSAVRLYGSSESRGFALLAVAISFGAVAATLFPRRRERDLSVLVGALGLIVGGIAFGELMSGSPLAFAWAGEAAVLAWLARRVKEIRYQLFAIAYLAAAAVHVLAIDVTPNHLFKPLEASAAGALAAVAAGAAAAAVAFFAAPRATFDARRGLFGLLAPLYQGLASRQLLLRAAGYWLSGAAAVYALSFGVLAAVPGFGWGHAAMYAVWSAIGLAVFTTGLLRSVGQVRAGGLVALGVTLVVAFVNGERSIDSDPRAATFFIVGAALLVAALADQLLPRRRGLTPVALGLVLGSVGIGLAAFVALLGGSVGGVDERGLGFLGLAALYAAFAAAVFRLEGQRDLSMLLWGAALVLGYGSSERLLPGTYHLLVLSLAAGVLAWLSLRVREPRFLAASGASVLVGVATVIFSLAPPGHLFRAQEHPGHGALDALFIAIAAAAVAHLARETELGRRAARAGWWTAGVLSVYGLSLFILELCQVSFGGSVDTDFHRGHTVVSAFWGLIGLVLLYVGLTRLRVLRVAGFAMFTVSLAKIFLFDLPSLSSITRALSFLAVGAVLLLGGFFYQRLATAQPALPRRRRDRVEWPRGLKRPELAVGLVAAAVLIVWFGSGLRPLGRSSEHASAASHGDNTTPAASLPRRPGARVPGARCHLSAVASGASTTIVVEGCSRAVERIDVTYPTTTDSGSFAATTGSDGTCPVRRAQVRCLLEPPLPPGFFLVVMGGEAERGSHLTISIGYVGARRSIARVSVR
jgi:uncharacterized membrane protein